MGVVPSLLEFEVTHGAHVIDEVFVTHPHWRPKRTNLVHYSGYENRDHPGDPINGPMSLDSLRHEGRTVARGRDVQSAVHGMLLGDQTAWPE